MARKFTPHDVIVFAFRDTYNAVTCNHWAEADDFATYVLSELALNGYQVVGAGAIKPKPTAPPADSGQSAG